MKFILGLFFLMGLMITLACQEFVLQDSSPINNQPIAGGPTLLREGISLRKVLAVGGGNIRLALNPANGDLYMLNPEGVFHLKADESLEKVAFSSDIVGYPTGMTFDANGALYVVANITADSSLGMGLVRRGVPKGDGRFSWETAMMTESYPNSGTNFDHQFNGIAISPDGAWIFVNSGSRTDHGEVQENNGAFPEAREVPLTSLMLRLPSNAKDLVLTNDEGFLKEQGFLFADGLRNSYDPAFAPNGELFAGENGPDADFPEELNWLREGRHYGFPWRFGTEDNPQQFADYDPGQDKRLSGDFVAVQRGTYVNDPSFPPPPGAFTDPVVNLGPDGDQYRNAEGRAGDASDDGLTTSTFTPHRSPLGLVFATDEKMPEALRSNDETLSAFILSWGSAGGSLTDRGQDLLHLRLSACNDNYDAITTQIATGFKNPIDAVLIENRLYVLEFGSEGAIWELMFE